MKTKKLYGVFVGTKWCMATNKRQALCYAKANKGFVTQMPYPDTVYWDAPTFRVCSDVIADYRQ